MLENIPNAELQILLFIQDHLRNDLLTPIMKFVSFLGDSGWFWMALCAVLILLPYLPFSRNLHTKRAGLTALLSLALGFLIGNLVLKNLFDRIRPYDVSTALIPLVKKPYDSSFPSGHTMAAFAVSLVLVRLLPQKAGIPLVILAVLTAFSRIYVGVHYPSDVLGGFLVGLCTSLIAMAVSQRIPAKQNV